VGEHVACCDADEFQPYWVAYARSLGLTPDDPSLRTYQYIGWISERWREWRRATGVQDERSLSDAQQVAFGAWLDEWAPAAPAGGEELTNDG